MKLACKTSLEIRSFATAVNFPLSTCEAIKLKTAQVECDHGPENSLKESYCQMHHPHDKGIGCRCYHASKQYAITARTGSQIARFASAVFPETMQWQRCFVVTWSFHWPNLALWPRGIICLGYASNKEIEKICKCLHVATWKLLSDILFEIINCL